MSLDSGECKCLQTCSQLPDSLQRSLKPLSISSLKSHITGTGRIFSSYFFLIRRQSLKGLLNRQKPRHSWQFYWAVLRFSLFFKVVFTFVVVVVVCSWKKLFLQCCVGNTMLNLSLGIFMGWMKDCVCERKLNTSLVQMLWLLFNLFPIR